MQTYRDRPIYWPQADERVRCAGVECFDPGGDDREEARRISRELGYLLVLLICFICAFPVGVGLGAAWALLP